MNRRLLRPLPALLVGVALMVMPTAAPGALAQQHRAPQLSAGPEYAAAHVFVQPGTLEAFIASWEATFGGTHTPPATVDILPTPSKVINSVIKSPVGLLSIVEPVDRVPYPYGLERASWAVTDVDEARRVAVSKGAVTVVAPYSNSVSRNTVVQFPGGVNLGAWRQFTMPVNPKLSTIPENRVYIPAEAADAFLRSYLGYTSGRVISDNRHADGAQIGTPGRTFRRISMTSPFINTVVIVSDGHLPYPFGWDQEGYTVTDLNQTLAKARTAGATVLWGPYAGRDRSSAIVKFPGGHIVEIHDGRLT